MVCCYFFNSFMYIVPSSVIFFINPPEVEILSHSTIVLVHPDLLTQLVSNSSFMQLVWETVRILTMLTWTHLPITLEQTVDNLLCITKAKVFLITGLLLWWLKTLKARVHPNLEDSAGQHLLILLCKERSLNSNINDNLENFIWIFFINDSFLQPMMI